MLPRIAVNFDIPALVHSEILGKLHNNCTKQANKGKQKEEREG
jgi:hypothetical protein